jgi:D-inositol-3-phosphate glycosyltransferase
MADLPKRIAMVSMHSSPLAQPGSGDAGGMNISILAVADQLARRGVEVDLVTRASADPGATELRPGVVLYELAAGPTGPLPMERLGPVTDEFGEGVASLAGRRSPRYDLIHAHYWLSGLATLPVALELGLQFVQSFHTVAAMKNSQLGPGQDPEPERRVLTERYLAGQASAIVAGSAAEATALIELVRAPADSIWVVPPGVDIERFTPARVSQADRVRTDLRIPLGTAVLAVIGRIQPLKDQELAIRALAEMPEPRPVLVVAGEPSPGEHAYGEELLDLTERLGVADLVRFTGALQRSELADLLAAADLVLVPSRSETFGLVAVEAAASGTPVVGSRAGGLIESISDGVSGVLVDSRRPEDWAGVIHSLLADPARLARMSLSARDHAEGYTWGATAAALLGVYTAVQAGRP